LQDAHMDFLAKLHEQGLLLAAGPLSGRTTREYRGLTIMRGNPEEVAKIKEQDPAVKAGKFAIKVIPWMVPAGRSNEFLADQISTFHRGSPSALTRCLH